MVARDGIEPPTPAFSGPLKYLQMLVEGDRNVYCVTKNTSHAQRPIQFRP